MTEEPLICFLPHTFAIMCAERFFVFCYVSCSVDWKTVGTYIVKIKIKNPEVTPHMTRNQTMDDLIARLAEAEDKAKRDAETIAKTNQALAEAEDKAKRDAETIAKTNQALAEAEDKAKRNAEALVESNTNLKSMMQLLEDNHDPNVGPPPIIGKQWVQNEQRAFAKIYRFILMNLRLYRRWYQYPSKLYRRKGGGTSRRQ